MAKIFVVALLMSCTHTRSNPCGIPEPNAPCYTAPSANGNRYPGRWVCMDMGEADWNWSCEF